MHTGQEGPQEKKPADRYEWKSWEQESTGCALQAGLAGTGGRAGAMICEVVVGPANPRGASPGPGLLAGHPANGKR